MEILQSFDFKLNSTLDMGLYYHAELIEGEYIVSWIRDGIKDDVDYSIQDIIDNIEDGSWIIVDLSNETFKSNEGITCPHCKHVYTDWQNYGVETDDIVGNFNMTCDECKKEFNCQFEFVVTFTTNQIK